MIKEKHKKDCKTCNRPFVVLKWSPGPRMRLKKIEVCDTCGAEKNICQACLQDLDNNLPVRMPDAALRNQDMLHKSDEGLQNVAREIENIDGTNPVGAIAAKSQTRTLRYPKVRSHTKTAEEYPVGQDKLAESDVTIPALRDHNIKVRPQVTYEPVDKSTDPDVTIPALREHNIKVRPQVTYEPVDKTLKRFHEMPKLEPPEDKTITTLFVGGLGDKVDEDDLKNIFKRYGEIKSVKMEPKQRHGFVKFKNRESAEAAARGFFCELTNTTLFVGGLGDKVDADDLKNIFIRYGEIKSVKMEPKQQGGFVEFTNRESAEAAARGLFCKLITTLFVGGLDDQVDADDLKNIFKQYGEIQSVKMEPKQHGGFVKFTNRESAEAAADGLFCKRIINGQVLRIKWFRSLKAKKKDENDEEEMSEPQPGPSGAKQRPSESMMLPSMKKRGDMPMEGCSPKGDFSMRQPFGMDSDDGPCEPYPYQSGMKAPLPPQEFHQSYTPSRGSASHSRESGEKVKPFGANLNVSSQNPNRKGPKH